MAVRDYIAKYVADLTGYHLEPAIKQTQTLEEQTNQTTTAVAQDYERLGARTRTAVAGVTTTVTREGGRAVTKAREVGHNIGSALGQSIATGTDAEGVAANIATSFAGGGVIGAAFLAVGAVAAKVFGDIQHEAELAAARTQQMFDDLTKGATEQEKRQHAITEVFGDTQEGLKQIRDETAKTGVTTEDLVKLYEDGLTPQTQKTYDALVKIRQEHTHIIANARGTTGEYDKTAQAANDVINNTDKITASLVTATENARTFQGIMDGTAGSAAAIRRELEKSATALSGVTHRQTATDYQRGRRQ